MGAGVERGVSEKVDAGHKDGGPDWILTRAENPLDSPEEMSGIWVCCGGRLRVGTTLWGWRSWYRCMKRCASDKKELSVSAADKGTGRESFGRLGTRTCHGTKLDTDGLRPAPG